MQSRLRIYTVSLTEVKDKLMKLKSTVETNSEEYGNITEALQFVQKALDAVSQTQYRVENLRSKRMSASN